MHRDARLYLDDSIEAITRIREYVAGTDYQVFVQERKTQDAVVRNLEIIGEAAGRLPESVKAAEEDIEWRKIVGMRNILAHAYFGISLPMVWDVGQHKLEPLEIACRKLLTGRIPDREEQE